VSGTTPPPEEVFGASALDLEAALRAEPDVDTARAHLDAFFLALLDRHGPHPAWAAALGFLEDSHGLGLISEVAEAAGMSPRNLERMFSRGLGFPPKTVARVLRFQHALRRLMSDPEVPLGDLATEVGYFDQPHFIRDFWQFTGGVPRGYRGYYPPDAPRDFAPNVVAFLQDLPAAAAPH
jgi:transcriptional regulator GlxA family with amidase domain